MNGHPWHRRYHSDALSGYLVLTLEERGAYTTILDLLYDRGEPLVDNERLIAGYLGVSVRKGRAVVLALIEKKKLFRTEDGRISNFRFEKERENELKTARKHAENGSKGGRTAAELKKNVNENSDGDLATLEPGSSRSTSTSTSRVIEETKVPSITARKRAAQVRADLNVEFDRVWAAYPKQLGEGAARKKWATVRRTHTYEEIASPLRACIRAVKGTDPQFIPKLSTWLAEERWKDNPEHAANRARSSTEDLRELARISSTDDLARLMAPQLRIAR